MTKYVEDLDVFQLSHSLDSYMFKFGNFLPTFQKSSLSCFFYVEKQVPISIDVVLDNVFKDNTNL